MRCELAQDSATRKLLSRDQPCQVTFKCAPHELTLSLDFIKLMTLVTTYYFGVATGGTPYLPIQENKLGGQLTP